MFEILIFGNKWKVFLAEEEKYIKIWGDTDAAHTLPSKKEIHFNDGELTQGIVRHELFHAFVSESSVDNSGLDGDQMEELAATLFEKHGDRITRLARKVYKELKKDEG
jgi:hypothetical protein